VNTIGSVLSRARKKLRELAKASSVANKAAPPKPKKIPKAKRPGPAG
jgi:hypothetical protein